MPRSRCRFLVPTNLNDGAPVAPEVFLRIKKELDAKFGGYRMIPPSEGCWQGQVEDTHEIEVLAYPRQVPELRSFVIGIGKELGQHRMYFEALPPSVELIDPETGLDEPDENDEEPDEKE